MLDERGSGADPVAVNAALSDRVAQLESQAEADRREIVSLQGALDSSRRIGAAVGIIMAARRITEFEAFDALRVASQTGNRKLRDVADDVVATGELRG